MALQQAQAARFSCVVGMNNSLRFFSPPASTTRHRCRSYKVILPDYLPGNPYSDLVQPVWCSYVLGARPATIVSPDGTIVLQQEWLQTVDLGDAIDEFWRKSEEMEGRHTGKGVGSVRSH